ncbi:MAG: TIM barrel protein [archaeon]|nr:TIM barrel protein [archaeon]
MKIGVKTFYNLEFLKYFADKVDFFEVQAIQTTPESFYSSLKQFSIPIVIHAEHYSFGVNYADKSKLDFNLKSINFARKIADLTGAKKIIAHPGVIEKGNPNCSEENTIDFLKNIDDERILIENLPAEEPDPLLTAQCITPEQISRLVKLTGKGFCFDINHALVARPVKDYNFVKSYIKLNPKHYHIGGQKIILILTPIFH